MKSEETKDYTLFKNKDDYDIDENRLCSLVKASEIIKEDLEQENLTVNQKNNKNESTIPNINSERKPDYTKFSTKAKIIDIEFDENFEILLSNKSITELDKLNKKPQYFNIKLKTDGEEWTEKFELDNRKVKRRTKNFIDVYGNGRIDNLIGTDIYIKPNYDKSTSSRYKIIIPEEKLTSILENKYEIYRSKIAKRPTNKDDSYFKYFTCNLIQLICTSLIIGSFGIFTYIIHNNIFTLQNITIEEGIMISTVMIIIWLIISFLLLLISLITSNKLSDNPTLVGDLELFILLKTLKSKNMIISKLKSANSYIGKLIS